MRAPFALVVSVASVASACLLACAAPSGSSVEASASAAEELSSSAPIPYVLQYVGEYDGDGSGDVDYVILKRNGRFEASVDGTIERGRYTGPSAPGEPLTIALVARGDRFTATLRTDYGQQPYRSVLTVTRDGATETLAGAFAGTEAMCDDSGGSWTDDDADPATGLFCVCAKPTRFIPSEGGCVR